jgi:two-component system NarL family sensor kinase
MEKSIHKGNQTHWFALEALSVCLLVYFYKGYMFMLFYSALLFVHQSHLSGRKTPFSIIILILFNALAESIPSGYLLIGNMMLITMAVLLHRLVNSSENQKEIEQLYDELRKKHYELEDARAAMLEHAKHVEMLAQAEERNRISSEIHDHLGHRLIRLKMMMEAAIEILPTRQDQSMPLLRQVRDELIESMEELRVTVRKMKPEEAVIKNYTLTKLIEETAQKNGIDIHYRISGTPYPMYPGQEIVFYRNVKEAITNAIRYAQAKRIDVHLHYGTAEMRLSVSNDGNKPEDGKIRKGLGILGMEERAALYGGYIQIEANERFTITTILPRDQKE